MSVVEVSYVDSEVIVRMFDIEMWVTEKTEILVDSVGCLDSFGC